MPNRYSHFFCKSLFLLRQRYNNIIFLKNIIIINLHSRVNFPSNIPHGFFDLTRRGHCPFTITTSLLRVTTATSRFESLPRFIHIPYRIARISRTRLSTKMHNPYPDHICVCVCVCLNLLHIFSSRFVRERSIYFPYRCVIMVYRQEKTNYVRFCLPTICVIFVPFPFLTTSQKTDLDDVL